MSLEETKDKLERRKRVFEYKQKNECRIGNRNDMIHIHDKEVNKIAEQNLLHDTINPTKRATNLRSHYSPILHGCIDIIDLVDQSLRNS